MNDLETALHAIDSMIAAFEKSNEALDRVWPILSSQDDVNGHLVSAINLLTDLDGAKEHDIGALREDLTALSNRIEGLTRVVMDADGGHSVKAL